jgi:hypothetical protein
LRGVVASRKAMQAEGDVIRFPEQASVPTDFAAFFAEEHRGLFKALYSSPGTGPTPPSSCRTPS